MGPQARGLATHLSLDSDKAAGDYGEQKPRDGRAEREIGPAQEIEDIRHIELLEVF
jgi:hypothetical protein